jgi:hypothetical protein
MTDWSVIVNSGQDDVCHVGVTDATQSRRALHDGFCAFKGEPYPQIRGGYCTPSPAGKERTREGTPDGRRDTHDGGGVAPDFAPLIVTAKRLLVTKAAAHQRHCERSEAIHSFAVVNMDCFAALAMTW